MAYQERKTVRCAQRVFAFIAAAVLLFTLTAEAQDLL
jgi:hypothetical protein